MTRRVPLPPDELLQGVGAGDFEKVGAETTQLIKQFAALRPDDRVLDVGSGLGRVTWPLAQQLPRGAYDGLDTVTHYIEWCRTGLGLDRARFRFHWADIYNSFYNPRGVVLPEQYRFPFRDNAFTLAIATSLFTHLSAEATVNYLSEIYRTLAPGGRFFGSFFVLDGYARKAIEEKPTYPLFTVEFTEGMTGDADNPDAAVAFDSEWLLGAFQRAGFSVLTFERGSWRRRPGPMLQDLVVATKPS